MMIAKTVKTLWALGWISAVVASARAEVIADIDVGSEGETAAFGFGWWRQERNPERTFRWIRFHREADVWLAMAGDPGATRIEIVAAPYFHRRRRQRLALYVNDRFIAQWEFPHGTDWVFRTLESAAPPGVFQRGRNRITLRAGYLGEKGYALAVERIRISRAP